MNLSASKAKLAKSTKELCLKWEGTRVHWHDRKSQEFEKQYLAALPDSVGAALTIIDEIEKLLNKVRKDCE